MGALLSPDKRISHVDSLAKYAAVGSSDQCNTIWGKVELEGDRDGAYGASGLVSGPESGLVASMETGAVVK
jgi:hypothetical protein